MTRREYNHAYYLANKDKWRAARLADPEANRERNRRWYRKHRKAICAHRRAIYAKNRKAMAAQVRERYRARKALPAKRVLPSWLTGECRA